MDKIKYSIIIPVHEVTNSNLLKGCVNSIVKNSLVGKYEIILIGNGCKGILADTILNLSNNYKNVKKFCNSSNLGMYKAFNQGAKHSIGKYLIFLHADSVIVDPEWLKKIQVQLVDQGAIAGGGLGGRLERNINSNKFDFFRHTLGADFNYIESWFYVIEKEKFEDVGMFDEEFSYMFGGEIDLSFRLKLDGLQQIIFNGIGIRHLKFDTADKQKDFNKEVLKDKNNRILYSKYQGNIVGSQIFTKRILVKMLSGELGDKLVVLGLVCEIKKRNPDCSIDIFLFSERYNTPTGYSSLFRGVVSNIFLKEKEFNEKLYHKVYTLSAAGIHQEEVDCSKNKEVQISRYQRWANKCELNFKGGVSNFYKVEENDGVLIREQLSKLKRPLIGISPFTSNPTKDWESYGESNEFSKWQKLINKIYLAGGTCILLHYKRLSYKNCAMFDMSLRELGYIISHLDLLIGTESGNTHFAGILEIPMMVFIGASSPLVLRHYNNVRILHKGECIDCNRFISPEIVGDVCGKAKDNQYSKCLTSITPKEVYDELCRFKGSEFNKKYLTNFKNV
jgi:GT2 family glycosyltransferase